MNMEKLLKAIDFAIEKHQGQLRKDNKTPYISHVLTVGLLLSSITKDPDIVIAGILHDTLEDTNTTEKEIEKLFGKKVLKMVLDCSNLNKTLPWEKRKELTLDKIKKMGKNSTLVKIADNLHNNHELVQNFKKDGIKYFDNFSTNRKEKMEYENQRLEIFKRYHKKNPLIKYIEKRIKYLNKEIKKIV